jgi:hypothetical protein
MMKQERDEVHADGGKNATQEENSTVGRMIIIMMSCSSLHLRELR